jgi:hypothetical protein
MIAFGFAWRQPAPAGAFENGSLMWVKAPARRRAASWSFCAEAQNEDAAGFAVGSGGDSRRQ